MKIINQMIDTIDDKKVCVEGKKYTLFVDSVRGDNAHILFIDKNEECKGEILAFVKEFGEPYTKNWTYKITGYYDMFLYNKDNKSLTPQMIKEAA